MVNLQVLGCLRGQLFSWDNNKSSNYRFPSVLKRKKRETNRDMLLSDMVLTDVFDWSIFCRSGRAYLHVCIVTTG